MEGKTVSEKILFMMLEELSEAYFAHDVMDILTERNPEDVMPWEWEANDRLSYFHFEGKFEGGIHTYCALKNVYKSICGNISDESEKELKKCAHEVADHQLEIGNWKKGREG